MEKIEAVVIIVFLVLGLALLVKAYLPIFKGKRSNNVSRDNGYQRELDILRSKSKQNGADSMKKADAFIRLMESSYVLVHILENQGNNYDDKVQSKNFQNSLTPEFIGRLNAVEGRYE